MNGGVADRIAREFSACAGELSPAGIADVAPARHKIPNDPEISQCTRIAPCTRRMSERMTSDSTGLSAPKKRKVCSSRKKAGSPRELRGEPVRGCDLLSGRSHSASCGLTRGLIVVSFGVARFRLQDFPGVVVAVLLGEKEPPAVAERLGNLGTEQTVHRRVAVGLEPAGNLVVAVVLESRHPTKLGIQSRRGITPFGKDPDRLIGWVAVVDIKVEEERRIERVALRVKRIASIFDENDAVCIPKSAVVKSRMRDIGVIQQRQYSGIPEQPKPEQGPESTKRRTRFGQRVGVASGVEDELREIRSWTELSILRALEGRA